MVISLKGNNEKWESYDESPEANNKFSRYRKTITGEFEFYIPKDCIVNIYICDEDGKQWDQFEENVPYEAGTYQYNFKLTTTNWPQGKYFLVIRADGELLYEKEFEI